MPLHRNESFQEKTMAFIGEDTFIKENHKLSESMLLYSRKLRVFQRLSYNLNLFLKVKE